MADFSVEIVTPEKLLLSEEVTEVVLPAHDGETGILAAHQDFVGVLGTGPLKFIQGGNDYWCVVSSGVYEIKEGKLSITAELGERAEDVNAEATRSRVGEIEKELDGLSLDDKLDLRKELAQQQARLEVHRRTELVN